MAPQNQSTKPALYPNVGKNTMGSMRRIYRNHCSITHVKTSGRVNSVLFSKKIQNKLQQEKEAWNTVCHLRNRCVKPEMYNPTDIELQEGLDALRALWLLLPPIKRHKGEKNKTFFIRTLHEVGRFRMVDMFCKENH